MENLIFEELGKISTIKREKKTITFDLKEFKEFLDGICDSDYGIWGVHLDKEHKDYQWVYFAYLGNFDKRIKGEIKNVKRI